MEPWGQLRAKGREIDFCGAGLPPGARPNGAEAKVLSLFSSPPLPLLSPQPPLSQSLLAPEQTTTSGPAQPSPSLTRPSPHSLFQPTNQSILP